jgi:hypothetical protein
LPPALIEYGWHVAAVQFSRAVREGCTHVDRHDGRRRASGLSKLNSMHGLELVGMTRGARGAPAARVSGTAAGLARFGRHARPHGRRPALPGPLATEVASGAGGAVPYGHRLVLPRKEVIQPHLPVRLPCYDFTPVTSPTFDGSLPCGLGHRLRVLLTPVV